MSFLHGVLCTRISPADSATYHSQHNQVLVIANSKGIEDGQVCTHVMCKSLFILLSFFQLVTVEIHRQSQ